MTREELIALMDEWIDDLAPLNRAAFGPCADAIIAKWKND